jgi:hypothetical protein
MDMEQEKASMRKQVTSAAMALTFMLGTAAPLPVLAQGADALEGVGQGMPGGIDALEGVGVPGGATGADALEGLSTTPPSGADALEGGGPGAAGAAAAAAAGPDIVCEAGAPCMETATQLPLRVLPRPLSNLYAQATVNPDGVVQANMPAFRPLYVFERLDVDLTDPANPTGWYRVGASKDAADGWMQARDVLEWRQALLVSYTHPGGVIDGRKPVLMFRELETLESLAEDFDRAARAEALYAQIDDGVSPPEVVSMEPKRFIDINDSLYFLPILRFEEMDIEGDEARLLQLAAAVPGARGADTLDDEAFRAGATADRGTAEAGAIEDLMVDVVFVLDTTRSTQPYIDSVKAAVQTMVTRMSDPDVAARVRFGMIGYRDAVNVVPDVEYETRVFTPEMVEAEALLGLLETDVRATPSGSLDYQEEVFAGMDAALDMPWRENALRFVILVGDASSHIKGHPQNITGKDEADLRREADDAQVHVMAVHLQDQRAADDHPLAQMQFAGLSRIRGRNESAYFVVDAFQQADFQAAVEEINDQFVSGLETALAARDGGNALGTDTAASADAAALPDADGDAGALAGKLWEAALIEYVGQGANPPKDIIGWALDRDLTNPAVRAMDVRVLVTRGQLNSLVTALDQIVQAFFQAEVSQGQFFDALQAVAGQTMKRPEDIGQAGTLADSGLLPAFVGSLPYRSEILTLTNDMYASMTAQQRSELEMNLLTKLEQYRTINEQPDAWTALNEGDPDIDWVYPLHLDYMP